MDELHGLPKVAALASKLVDLVMDQVAADRCLNRENIRNAMMGPLVTFQLEAEAAIRRAAKPDVAAPKVAPRIIGWDIATGPNATLVWKNQTDDNLEALAIERSVREMARKYPTSPDGKPGSLSKFAVDEAGGIWMHAGPEVWTKDIPAATIVPNTEAPIWKWSPCGTMRQLFWTDARMLERRAYAEATGRCATLFADLDLAITPEGEVISELEAIKRGAL
jgi:hypothetical protein